MAMSMWQLPIFIFFILVIRYFLLSVLAYKFFWQWKKDTFSHLRIQKTFPKFEDLQREVIWSLSSFLVFSAGAFLVYIPILSGHTKFYFDFEQYGLGYAILSFILVLFIQDTYFYWIHRFMHMKWVFKYVHQTHHRSLNPSPLAVFAFHPLEAAIEWAFIVIAIFFIPLHPITLSLFLLFSHAMNVIGHLGYEIFPSNFVRHPIFKWLNSSTHHNMHHQHFSSNYGFYFNIWDRLLGTNNSRYEQAFSEIVQQQKKREN